MTRIVGICVILSILGASLEGAADLAGSDDPCCDGGVCVFGDPIHMTEPAGDADAEHGCIACTPFCHCGAHAGALLASLPDGTSPMPTAVPAHIAPHYVSFIDPPALPPPIARLI